MKHYVVRGEFWGRSQKGKVYEGHFIRSYISQEHKFDVIPNCKALIVLNDNFKIRYKLTLSDNTEFTKVFNWVNSNNNVVSFENETFNNPPILLIIMNLYGGVMRVSNINFSTGATLKEVNISLPPAVKAEVSFEINNCVFLEIKFITNRYAEID